MKQLEWKFILLNWGQSGQKSAFSVVYSRSDFQTIHQINYIRNKGKCSNHLNWQIWQSEYWVFWSSPVDCYKFITVVDISWYLLNSNYSSKIHDCDSDTGSCQGLTTKFTFLYIKVPKKYLAPNVHESLSIYIFICLPLLSKKQLAKHFHTYKTLVAKVKIRYSLWIFQTPDITPEKTEAKIEGFNISSVFCFVSQVLDIKS